MSVILSDKGGSLVAEGIFSFKVGDFDCMVISDGYHVYEEPIQLLFPDAPEVELAKLLQEHNLKLDDFREFNSSYSCLLVDTGEYLVLIDTGAGELLAGAGELFKNLEIAKISPDDIDVVILTHGHPDHIGGNTTKDGKSVLPNSRYIMMEEEWNFWIFEEAENVLEKSELDKNFQKMLLHIAEMNLLSIREQVDFVQDEEEIVSGIKALLTPGHTPGQMVPLIASKNERVYSISDTFIHPIHFERPEWYTAVDVYPEQVKAARDNLIKRIAKEEALVHAFHFPFPGLGYVREKKGVFRWEPVSFDGSI